MKLRKSSRIESIMNKKKEESSSTDIIELTCPSDLAKCTQKGKLYKSKRDEMHSNSNKKIKK